MNVDEYEIGGVTLLDDIGLDIVKIFIKPLINCKFYYDF